MSPEWSIFFYVNTRRLRRLQGPRKDSGVGPAQVALGKNNCLKNRAENGLRRALFGSKRNRLAQGRRVGPAERPNVIFSSKKLRYRYRLV